MPPTQSTPWHEELIKLVNETFGIPGSGGYLTGIDLITLPVAFGAGCIVGVRARVCKIIYKKSARRP